jgi:DNA-binding transcriptional MocR family regulator
MKLPTIGHNSKSNRADFQRDREMWLIQVLGDRGASPMAKVVATAISIHMNGETRQAWPSHSRLAEMCAADKRTIERATKELETRKHLRVSRKTNCANRYEMAKLPAETQEVPLKMLPPTGENAKGTGENGGRTSEEPLSEPHIEPLKEEAAPPSSFGNDVRRCSGRKKGVGRAKRAKEDWSQ